MIWGLDLLASAKYKKVAVASLPEGWAVGGFDNTFGDFMPVAKAAVKVGARLIRVQMLWEDDHEYGDKHIPRLKKIAQRWQRFAKSNPLVKVELSFFCEHLLDNPDKYGDIVANIAPACEVVCTPGDRGARSGSYSKKYKNECHGLRKKPTKGRYNYSFDGTDCTQVDIESFKLRHSEAEVFFFWCPRFNLRWSMKDQTPRPDRTGYPTRDVISGVAYLHMNKGKTALPAKTTVKSWAENHGPGKNGKPDLKGDKLLIIYPQKVSKIELFTNAGILIDTLSFYGSFQGGGFRYYSGRMGFKNSMLAESVQGDPRLTIWINKKAVGVCNPAFRDGTFRTD